EGNPDIRRNVVHQRGDYFLVIDEVSAPEAVDVDWLAQIPASGVVDDGRITLVSRPGDLRLNLIYPEGGTFETRKPTSKHVDNPNKSQRSYTVSQNGQQVGYTMLMQPVFSEKPVSDLEAKVVSHESGQWDISVGAEEWEDVVCVLPMRGPMELTVPGTEDIVSLEARAAIIRGADKKLVNVFAAEVEVIDCKPMYLELDAPAGIELAAHDGGWVLDIDTSVTATMTLAKGLKFYDASSSPVKISDEGVSLDEGSYVLAANASDAGKLISWAAERNPEHDLPSIPVAKKVKMGPAPAEISLGWEAEDGYVMSDSAVEVTEKIGASAGKALKGVGNGGAGEMIEWTVDIKRAGTYHLSMRYCAEKPTGLTLLVDGFAPTEEALHIPLKGTGGWSNTKDDWQEVVLKGSDGKDLEIPLSMGKHTIKLIMPTAPVNIDSFTLSGY
ncbi:MAG: carbohydrate-binding protein, partial [Puniceicoccales bacterium]